MSDFPKNLLSAASGFPELLPAEAIAQQRVLDIIRKHYERAGFVPIETPLVERTEVLTAKSEGEVHTQIYGLRLLNPAEGAPTDSKDLALRFDQTVPLARFVAAHPRDISFPFRRYAIGSVFRGEKPKEGRYRQFIQADIDVIGDGALDPTHDAECVATVANIFKELEIGQFTIRIGNRKVLEGIFEALEYPDELVGVAFECLDKIEKIGVDMAADEFVNKAIRQLQIDDVSSAKLKNSFVDEVAGKLQKLASLGISAVTETLKHIIPDNLSQGGKTIPAGYYEGVAEVCALVDGLIALGIQETNFQIDLSIVRGLSYYTGNVFETRLDEHPDIGSIASGGRYDNLAAAYSDKNYPGVGISIGVSRLLPRLIKTGLVKADTSTIAKVIVTTALPLAEHAPVYLRQAALLREAGIPTEAYLTDRALGKELEYANKRGFSIALITGEEELTKGTVSIRDLRTGDQTEVHEKALVETIRSMVNE